MQQVATYTPGVFDVTSLAEAQAIILTPEDGRETSERWVTETPYLGELIQSQLGLSADSLILDHGCGVGRLSKELINRTGCRVIGVDISPNMRMLALRYVDSPRFTAVSPEMLDYLVMERDLKFDGALSVWVLQHCLDLEAELRRISLSLHHGAGFFIVNEEHRCVPSDMGWVDDGKNTRGELLDKFSLTAEGQLSADIFPAQGRAFWARYRA